MLQLMLLQMMLAAQTLPAHVTAVGQLVVGLVGAPVSLHVNLLDEPAVTLVTGEPRLARVKAHVHRQRLL